MDKTKKRKAERRTKKSSVYRGARVLKGYRRVEAMLSPDAVRALEKLTKGGVPATRAVCKALIDAARKG